MNSMSMPFPFPKKTDQLCSLLYAWRYLAAHDHEASRPASCEAGWLYFIFFHLSKRFNGFIYAHVQHIINILHFLYVTSNTTSSTVFFTITSQTRLYIGDEIVYTPSLPRSIITTTINIKGIMFC